MVIMMQRTTDRISVIVPVYNVERYLARCLDSLLKQTYSNYEIVVIDDGSTDDSPRICDSYALKSDRIKVIHKLNGGLSSARNRGIQEATGCYLTFVDSDDALWEESLEVLLKYSRMYNADIVQALYSYDENTLGQWRGEKEVKAFSTGREAIIDYLEFGQLNEASTVKLYKAGLFESIRFPDGKVSEDTLTTYKLIYAANTVVSINLIIYYYMYNENGILHSRFSKKRFDILGVFEEMEDTLDLSDMGIKRAYNYYKARRLLFFYNQCIALGADANFQEEVSRVRVKALESEKDVKELGPRYRLLFVLLRFMPHFYRFLVLTARSPEREVTEGKERKRSESQGQND